MLLKYEYYLWYNPNKYIRHGRILQFKKKYQKFLVAQNCIRTEPYLTQKEYQNIDLKIAITFISKKILDPFFYAILSDQTLLTSYLSILIMPNMQRCLLKIFTISNLKRILCKKGKNTQVINCKNIYGVFAKYGKSSFVFWSTLIMHRYGAPYLNVNTCGES